MCLADDAQRELLVHALVVEAVAVGWLAVRDLPSGERCEQSYRIKIFILKHLAISARLRHDGTIEAWPEALGNGGGGPHLVIPKPLLDLLQLAGHLPVARATRRLELRQVHTQPCNHEKDTARACDNLLRSQRRVAFTCRKTEPLAHT